jgi:hypothetical protein
LPKIAPTTSYAFALVRPALSLDRHRILDLLPLLHLDDSPGQVAVLDTAFQGFRKLIDAPSDSLDQVGEHAELRHPLRTGCPWRTSLTNRMVLSAMCHAPKLGVFLCCIVLCDWISSSTTPPPKTFKFSLLSTDKRNTREEDEHPVQSLHTGKSNLRYEPTPARRLFSRLALWLAILTFTPPIAALPNRLASYTVADYPTADAMPNQSQDQVLQQTEGTPSDKQKDAQPQSLNDSRLDSLAEAKKPDSSLNAPCLHDISSAVSAPANTTNKRCGKPLVTQQGIGFRFGHRMRTRNSMLGDFDGVMLDYGLGRFAVNGIAGFPASGNDQINPKNHLYGFSASSGKLAKGWDLGGYMMEFQGVGQDSRSALGGAIRYSQANRSLLVSADYDLLKHTLSRFMISSAWKLLPTATLSTTLDIQQSYLPTPQKNYLKQSIALTDGWKWGLPLDRIKDLSKHSATDVAAFGLSLSHAVSQNLKLESDFSILNVSEEDDSNNLETALSNFNEYYFYFKLTGKGLLFTGDSNTITLRHNVSDTSRRSSYLMDGSYDFSRQWHLAPRLQIEYRDSLSDHTTQWRASPAVKLEYRWHNQSRINLKAAGEWMKKQPSADEAYHASYVVSLGYRVDF